MFETVERNFMRLLSWLGFKEESDSGLRKGHMSIIRKGSAMRVIFFYPGEEGTYVDNADVILYENGIVHINSNQEETTTHLQNCEILWRFETDADDRASKVRLLKPKTDVRTGDDASNSKLEPKANGKLDLKADTKPGKGNPSKNPELVE